MIEGMPRGTDSARLRGRGDRAAACFAAVPNDAIGTKRTTSDVRNSVANGDKPDIARTAHFGRD